MLERRQWKEVVVWGDSRRRSARVQPHASKIRLPCLMLWRRYSDPCESWPDLQRLY